jgi:hypothetical protein
MKNAIKTFLCAIGIHTSWSKWRTVEEPELIYQARQCNHCRTKQHKGQTLRRDLKK